MLFFFSSYNTKTGRYLRTNESCADVLSYIVRMPTFQVPGVFPFIYLTFLTKMPFFAFKYPFWMNSIQLFHQSQVYTLQMLGLNQSQFLG
jgi:hypothetical protein